MILGDTLNKAYKFYSSKPAIICGNHRWTYGEFFDRVSRLSSFLRGSGIGPDGKIAILHPNCHYFLETYYAAARIGAVSVPINFRLSPPEIAYILNHSESKLLVVDPMFKTQIDAIRAEIPGVKTILWTGEGTDADLTYDAVLEQTGAYRPTGRACDPAGGYGPDLLYQRNNGQAQRGYALPQECVRPRPGHHCGAAPDR